MARPAGKLGTGPTWNAVWTDPHAPRPGDVTVMVAGPLAWVRMMALASPESVVSESAESRVPWVVRNVISALVKRSRLRQAT